MRLTKEQNDFLGRKTNKSAYIRSLLDREMKREEGWIEKRIREIVQEMLGNYQFVPSAADETMESQCVSGLLEILN